MLDTCGDGETQAPEECDDANAVSGDGCDTNCTRTRCGNGIVTTGEQCDDANASNGDCCGASCRFDPAGTPCDDRQPCTNADACASGVCSGAITPAVGCRTAGSGAVLVRDGGDGASDLLKWRWKNGPATTLAELGDPLADGTTYTLCVYDTDSGRTRALAGTTIDAGDQCGDEPCWKEIGGGFRYRRRSAPERLQFLVKTDASGRAKLVLKRKGDFLPGSRMPVAQDPRVTVQLVNGSDVCWETMHVAPPQRSDDTEFADGQD